MYKRTKKPHHKKEERESSKEKIQVEDCLLISLENNLEYQKLLNQIQIGLDQTPEQKVQTESEAKEVLKSVLYTLLTPDQRIQVDKYQEMRFLYHNIRISNIILNNMMKQYENDSVVFLLCWMLKEEKKGSKMIIIENMNLSPMVYALIQTFQDAYEFGL